MSHYAFKSKKIVLIHLCHLHFSASVMNIVPDAEAAVWFKTNLLDPGLLVSWT